MAFDDSIKRFERIVAILIQLQSKRIVRAQDIADRFDVSLRTVYRDVRALEAAGVPIYSEAGVGYSLIDGYKLPPIMLTQEEAATFVAAEQLMLQYLDQNLGKHFLSAVSKIKSVLREEQKDRIASLEPHLKVVPHRQLFKNTVPDVLEIILESIAEKRQIILDYQAINADTPTERRIEPVGMLQENGHWYLLGYCHLRQDYRNFRTDRIHGIHRTELAFTREHEPLDSYLKRERVHRKERIVLSVDKDAARYMRWDRHHYGFVSEEEKGNKVEMLFESDYRFNGFERWFMMYADSADILEPKELIERVGHLLDEIGRRFRP